MAPMVVQLELDLDISDAKAQGLSLRDKREEVELATLAGNPLYHLLAGPPSFSC